MKNYQLTLHCDLDGVLADFEGRIQQLTGMPCKDLPRGKLWATVGRYDKDVGPFFESLEKMPDADELWAFITEHFHDVKILTAAGYTPKNGADQKIAWVAKHFGEHIPVKVVSSGSIKFEDGRAHPKAVLVDDTRKALDPWVKAGGIEVFHTSATDSIEKLKIILDQYR